MTWVILRDIRAALLRAQEGITAAFQGFAQLQPVADFGWSILTGNTLTVTFADSSFDPKGGNIISWLWTFGDGQTATTQNPTHTYAASGSYLVTLLVTDDTGLTAIRQSTSTVSQVIIDPGPGSLPVPPVALFSATDLGGHQAQFTDTSTDADGTVLSWVWTFGEGPTANFSTSITNLQITFTDTSTAVSPATLATRSWRFGDGSVSTATNPVHVYTASGTYAVGLDVTDSLGNPATTDQQVTVTSGVTPTLGRPLGCSSFWSGTVRPTLGAASFNASLDGVSPASLASKLQAAHTVGHGFILAMTGGAHSNYITNGQFDLVKWKAKMDTYNTTAIKAAMATAVTNRSALGCSVMDEPAHPSWGGVMTKALLDQMATYVKGIFPTLPVGVVTHPDWQSTSHYTVMDFIVSEWCPREYSAATFLARSNTVAAADGVRLYFNINLIDCGTDVALCPLPQTGGPGTFGGHCRMTATQVNDYCLQVTSALACLGLNLWRYDTDMFGQAAYQTSFAAVRADLDTRTATPLSGWYR